MRQRVSLSIIIPTYNDEATIAKVLVESESIAKRLATSYEIIVINDGSSDRTGEILKTCQQNHRNLRVITHALNKGYGATIRQLYKEAKKDWIFSTPGDYQIRPDQLIRLMLYISDADMIVGWRRERKDPPKRLFASSFYNWLIRVLFRLPIHDVNSVRLISNKLLKTVRLDSTTAFVDAELTIKSHRLKARIIEVSIAHLPSIKRGSGGNLKTMIPTIIDMIRFWLLRE